MLWLQATYISALSGWFSCFKYTCNTEKWIESIVPWIIIVFDWSGTREKQKPAHPKPWRRFSRVKLYSVQFCASKWQNIESVKSLVQSRCIPVSLWIPARSRHDETKLNMRISSCIKRLFKTVYISILYAPERATEATLPTISRIKDIRSRTRLKQNRKHLFYFH